MTAFNEFGLDVRISTAVEALGFEKATPIQENSLPVLLEGRDVIGRARTGSGKTAAFGLPMLEKVKDGGPNVRALILAPTRELAIQVGEAIKTFSVNLKIRTTTIYGGAPYGPQLKALRKGVTVVVGTPGRVIDHMKKGTLDLSSLDMLILDEADEMLRMGFIEAIEEVLQALPSDRQIALFSATMPKAIERIAKKFLVDPVILPVDDDGVEHIDQCYLRVPQRKKLAALTRVLMGTARGTTLVFARTRLGCAEVATQLGKRGITADAIHGDLNQAARERVIARLKNKDVRVLVATDVASRGIDIRHITHVINLDLPGDTESYVHRIGRTGRAGAEGSAITFVTPGERRRLNTMQKTLKIHMKEVFAPKNDQLLQLQRDDIWGDLQRFMKPNKPNKQLQEWLEKLTDSEELSVEDIALAALAMLSDQRAIPVEEVDVKPEKRNKSLPSDDDRNLVNEVEVFLAIGRRAGVQVGDIVGAITNEAGVPGSKIGRISMFDHKTFIGVPRDVAEHLLSEHPVLVIRGNSANVSLARGGGKGGSGERGAKPFNRGRGGPGGGPRSNTRNKSKHGHKRYGGKDRGRN
jgi:ATP-dependent RNA helicase DeaD